MISDGQEIKIYFLFQLLDLSSLLMTQRIFHRSVLILLLKMITAQNVKLFVQILRKLIIEFLLVPVEELLLGTNYKTDN